MKNSSLARDYFIFSIIVVVILITAMFLISLTFYRSEQENNNHILSIKAKQIEKSISESFDYTNRISTYMGKQIAQHGANDLEYILDLFRKTSAMQYRVQGLFSWSLFDWVDANNLQLLNSKNGISKNPPDMSHRDYSWKSPKYPWTLQVSKPAIGNPSGKWVVPAGVGITDKENKYLGSIVVGFNVEELTGNITQKASDNTVSFVVLDNHYRIVMQSADNNLDPASSYYKNLFAQKESFVNESGELFLESEDQTIKYSQYRKIDDYDYIVLTGFNKSILLKNFHQTLLPRLLEFTGLGLFFLVMLYIFRRYIISPVAKLADAADKIAHGVIIKKVPRGTSKETNILAKQLVSVMRYMNKEKRDKEQLEKAKFELENALISLNHNKNEKNQIEKTIIATKEAKLAKDNLLKRIRLEMSTPLKDIINCSETIMQEKFGNLPDGYKDIAEDIFKCGYSLATTLPSNINYSKFNLEKSISESVSFYKDKLHLSNIKCNVYIDSNIYEIYADEVRFRQIIVSTLYHSLSLTPSDETINIKVHLEEKDFNELLVIEISDTGFGADEKYRIKTIDNIRGNDLARSSDGTDLPIIDIRKLVTLHKGLFEIKLSGNKGTIFTIKVPYGCEALEDNSDAYLKNRSKYGSDQDNVVSLFNK